METVQVRELDPGECTPGYRAGWMYAEWWLGKGGDVMADPCDNWRDDKANGFADRLKNERDHLQQQNA